jgi:membrane fusion protein
MLVPIDGYAKIYALHPGVVTSILVKEGDRVEAGDKVAIIRTEMPNAAGGVATDQQMASINSQTRNAISQIGFAGRHAESEADRLTGMIDGLKKQAESYREQIELENEVVKSQSDQLSIVEPILAKGFMSKAEYERRKQALLAEKQQLLRLKQQLDNATAEIGRSQKERDEAVIAGESDTSNARSAIEIYRQQKIRLAGEASYSVVAAMAGHVTAIQVNNGRTVDSAIPMMLVVPDESPLRADIYVPSRSIGFLHPGQEVRLLYDAFPYQKFGTYTAHIKNISGLAVPGQETDAPFKIDGPVYKVTATLDQQSIRAYGQIIKLHPGITLSADIILARQSFIDWLLDPLRAISHRN